MDDKFEDKIRESLNSPPDYPFEERVWQDLEGRLDQLDKRQPRTGYPFWWLPVLAAIPLLLLFWLWGAYQQQGAELAQLQQGARQSQVTIMDTIVRRTVVMEYDTIYRTVYETTVIKDDPRSRHGQLYPSPSILLGNNGSFYNLRSEKSSLTSVDGSRWLPWGTIPSAWGTRPGGLEEETTAKDRTAPGTADLASREMTMGKWNKSPTTPLPFRFFFLNYAGEEGLPAIVTPTIEPRNKTLTERLASVLPAQVRIGFSGGTFAANGLPELEKQSNFSGALLAELSYSRHLSIVLGAEYLANSFGLKHDDDADFSGFPIVTPNSPADELEKLQGDFRYWQFPLGVKYRMLVKKRLSPYVGAGVMAIRPTQSLLNYEYESSGNLYYSLSQDDFLSRNLMLEDAWLMLGVEYYLGKNWSVLLDANAQWSFGKANNIIEKREFLKGRLGFGYAF